MVVAGLVLAIVVAAWQWTRARAAVERSRAELERVSQQAREAERRLESAEQDSRAARDEAKSLADRLRDAEASRAAGGFDAECIYKLLAKGSLDSPDGQRTYGVVQEDSGTVRPFVIDGTLDHLEEGACFGVLRGKLARLSEDEFKGESATARPGSPPEEPGDSAAPATQVRKAVQSEPDAGASAPAQEASQKTALFVASEPEQPKDPNEGLPYLAVDDGDDGTRIHHLAFDRLTAGRGPDNDIVLEDQNASRKHFTVTFTGNRFLLEDNDSTNGTFCNGERIIRKWLEFGDRIEVGSTVIRFSYEGYDLKDQDPERALAALEACVERQPDFIDALKLLAYMLERDVARKKEAASHWERIARLEASS